MKRVMLPHFRSGFCCRQRTVRHTGSKKLAEVEYSLATYWKGISSHLFAHEADAENFPSEYAPDQSNKLEEGICSLARTSPSTQLHNYTKVVVFVHQPPSRPEQYASHTSLASQRSSSAIMHFERKRTPRNGPRPCLNSSKSRSLR